MNMLRTTYLDDVSAPSVQLATFAMTFRRRFSDSEIEKKRIAECPEGSALLALIDDKAPTAVKDAFSVEVREHFLHNEPLARFYMTAIQAAIMWGRGVTSLRSTVHRETARRTTVIEIHVIVESGDDWQMPNQTPPPPAVPGKRRLVFKSRGEDAHSS